MGKAGGKSGTRSKAGTPEPAETGEEAEPVSFEGALDQLEATVARLEDGELPLEQALDLFERGVKLSRQCATTLETAERRIEIRVAERDGAAASDEEGWSVESFAADDEEDDDFEDELEDED